MLTGVTNLLVPSVRLVAAGQHAVGGGPVVIGVNAALALATGKCRYVAHSALATNKSNNRWETTGRRLDIPSSTRADHQAVPNSPHRE
ncbi:hypothetical protein JK2ML_0070 [Mycobacterium leprae Kyoto-2]|uniref:Uncharacterized protein n=3 Tax=Mycobacterium leprae TaxID=1769 RepID=Q9CDC8_MYCLE|nr:hypothetical protein DIJ64_00355 [Mycobacterium leprae]OAR21321.1 hypothetical protein A8144_06885 [Mycobacterium leprae 3125609]OAX71406.1 hypothetical protein A3216_06060 [Mycobacterium leprae 7935681]CAR70163.1 hypothetical protein MLBr00070 [Mycobacterium leprae Br4923]BBC16340.1 hypothetical protein JK2ML_0070 [Mycobacterium leprae Kyoto-2]